MVSSKWDNTRIIATNEKNTTYNPHPPIEENTQTPSSEVIDSVNLTNDQVLSSAYQNVNEGNSDDAIISIKAQLEKNPDDPGLNGELGGIIYYVKNNPEKAYEYFKKSFQFDFNNGAVAYDLINTAIATNRADEARELIKSAKENGADDTMISAAEAYLNAKSGKEKEAISQYKKLEQESGDAQFQAENSLAHIYLNRKDYANAAKYFEKTVESQLNNEVSSNDPQASARVITSMGNYIESLVASKRYEKAQKQMDRLAEIFPNHSDANKVIDYYSQKLKAGSQK